MKNRQAHISALHDLMKMIMSNMLSKNKEHKDKDEDEDEKEEKKDSKKLPKVGDLKDEECEEYEEEEEEDKPKGKTLSITEIGMIPNMQTKPKKSSANKKSRKIYP